jgi:O-antigen/teichoic acid export membrane protein
MSFIQRITASWRDDPLLRRVAGSSSVLFSSNSISLVLSVVQSILAARLLGPAGLGLVGIVMSYASTVNGFFSFRMSELVVKYGGEYLENKQYDQAAALMKAAGFGEAAVSVLAFLFVVLTAHWASVTIAKTPGTEWLLIAYAAGLLANFNVETSTGILQVTDRIKLQGWINLVQSIATAVIIAVAFFSNGSIQMVLGAYLIGKAIIGLGLFITAQFQLRRVLGRGWLGNPITSLPSLRAWFKFAFSSNLSATLILIFRESELLWVGYFLTTEAAGYYKAAYAIVSLLSVPANPLILATYPEINKLVVQKAWPRLRDFLRKITTLSAVYNLALAAGFVLFGKWLLWIYGKQYLPAYPAMLALLVGLVFNYILFWNRPLLLALGHPEFPLKATLAAGLAKTALAFPLVPRFGFVAEAVLLSVYYLSSVGAMVRRGWIEIRRQEVEIQWQGETKEDFEDTL